MKKQDYLQQSTGPGQPTQHPQTTESDFSGVTQPQVTASRSAETSESNNNMRQPACSYFPIGYRNKKGKAVMDNHPKGTKSLLDIYAYITDYAYAGIQTEQLRKLTDKPLQRDFKMLNFEYVTFCGIFSYRMADLLQDESGLMVVDIDDLKSPEEALELKSKLCVDKHYVTALCFISPLEHGVKWIVERQPIEGQNYKDEMNRMYNYMAFEYGIALDTSGSDICRACYLPYDKDCYINSKYLKK